MRMEVHVMMRLDSTSVYVEQDLKEPTAKSVRKT